jgi:hypothetical protein
MNVLAQLRCTAFAGQRRIAAGELKQTVSTVKALVDKGEKSPILIFDDATSELVEVDLRGTRRDVLKKLAEAAGGAGADANAVAPGGDATRGPGRPKLGVVAREVTLLPRHWAWLGTQPGGASVALRKLVEDARRTHSGKDRIRHAQEVCYKFMSAIAGDMPGFEEAARALYARDAKKFEATIDAWPADVRNHAKSLAVAAFP